MQENEFEKKLQQKLETLQVQPTDEVWQKVKEQVAQKKRKRKFAFLFLLVAMMGTGAVVTNWLMNRSADNFITVNEKVKAGATKKNNEQVALNQTVAGNATENKVAENDITQTNTTYNNSTHNTTSNSKQAAASTTSISAVPEKEMTVTTTNSVYKAAKRTSKGKLAVHTAEGSVETGNVNSQDIADGITQNKEAGSLATTVQSIEENKKELTEAVVPDKKMPTEINAPTQPEKTIAAAKKEKKNDGVKKWGIGFSISGGTNFVTGSDLQKSLAQDYNSGGLGSTPGNGSSGYLPSSIKQGLALSAGIQVYRQVSSSVKINAGLQFDYKTLSTKTGGNVDSPLATRDFYSYGSSATYTNRYYYLSLPVSVSVKLFNIANKDISLDAGGSISRLLATNALAFDNTLGRYYTMSDELNKTVVSLSAAAFVNLAGNNKPAFYIGPQFTYQVTSMASTGMHRGMHPGFIGLRLQKNLSK